LPCSPPSLSILHTIHSRTINEYSVTHSPSL
jgi:hypothetical protein